MQAGSCGSVQHPGIWGTPWSTTTDPSGALLKSSNMPSKSRPTVSGSKYLHDRQAARAWTGVRVLRLVHSHCQPSQVRAYAWSLAPCQLSQAEDTAQEGPTVLFTGTLPHDCR